MARPLRIELPGALYHAMSRGNERQQIVRDDFLEVNRYPTTAVAVALGPARE